VELAEKLELSEGIASGCGALCNVFEARGDLASYAQTSERQVAALDQSGDLYGIYDAYFHMINLGNQRGDYAQVKRYALEGMELCQKFNAPPVGPIRLAICLLSILQDAGEALNHGKRVLPLFERVGCSTCFMFIFWNLADIEAKRGQHEQSQQYFNSAMDIKSQLMLDPATDMRWNLFGHVLRQEWKLAWAQIERYRTAGYTLLGVINTSMGMLGWMISEAAVRAGQLEEAQRALLWSQNLFQSARHAIRDYISHFALGLTNAVQEQWDEALTGFEQALNIYRTLNHPWIWRYTLRNGDGSYKAQDEGDQEKARRN
jgi:tetratricopeptide (TPR) repeat protein